jgi:hypothetical protein
MWPDAEALAQLLTLLPNLDGKLYNSKKKIILLTAETERFCIPFGNVSECRVPF